MKKKKKYILGVLVLIIIIFCICYFKTNDTENNKLLLEIHIDYDSDEDLDGDGLSNKEEKKYKTNVLAADTDLDGLTDGEEANTYHTDPLKKDTDGDKLDDYNEVKLSFNPLEKDSNKNGVIDSLEESEYTFSDYNLELSVSGTGNIASTYAYVENNTLYSSLDGVINKEYSFYSEGNIDSLTVSFGYTEEELKSVYCSLYEIDSFRIFQVSKENFNDFKMLDGIIDPENQTFTVSLKDIDKYFYVFGDAKQVYYEDGGSKYDSSKEDLILLGDSGFDVKKNGFNFKNYISNYAETGHCFGMSMFADLYYQKKLPLKEEGKNIGYRTNLSFEGIVTIFVNGLTNKTDFKPSFAYDLTNTYFKDYKNLYDYKVSYNMDQKFDEEKLQTEKGVKKGDKQLLNAIYQLHTMQAVVPMVDSGKIDQANMVSCNDMFTATKVCYSDGKVSLDVLANRLKNHEAAVISYFPNGGAHAVNAIRLYRYRQNNNKYKLIYYDNRFPGEEQSMDITCSKKVCMVDEKHGSNTFGVARSTEDELNAFSKTATWGEILAN